jgi:HEAT repeats
LESALATSPEAAMKVIPGLLRHESKRWRIAAIQLLKDIGTDEALDQLVQLLAHENSFIRAEAGKALAVLIKSRNRDLRDRAALLPEREDTNIWPLDKVFPGKLAIPIAESLVESGDAGNQAVDCAVKALRVIKESRQKSEHRFLRAWRNVSRDLTLREYKLVVGKALVVIGGLIPVVFMVGILALNLWAKRKDKVIIVEMEPTHVHLISRESLRNGQGKARAIVSETEKRYPPNASGLSRVLPWNWFVEPVLPEGESVTYNRIRDSDMGFDDPFILRDGLRELNGIPALVPKENAEGLKEAVTALDQSLPLLNSRRYAIISYNSFVITFIVMIALVPVFGAFMKRKMIRRSFLHRRRSGWVLFINTHITYFMLSFLALEFLIILPRGNALTPFRISLILGSLSWIAIGAFIQRLR